MVDWFKLVGVGGLVAWAIGLVLSLALLIVAGYVAYHFIAKWW